MFSIQIVSETKGRDAALTREGTRMRLIKSAAYLFQENGYFAVGVAKILAHAETPKGSLYHYFPGGKEELAIAAVEWVSGETVSLLRMAQKWSSDPRDVLPKIALSIAVWLEANDWIQGSLIAMLAQETATSAPAIFAAVTKSYDSILVELTAIVKLTGRDADEAARIAELALALIEGATIVSRVTRNSSSLEAAAVLITEQLAANPT